MIKHHITKFCGRVLFVFEFYIKIDDVDEYWVKIIDFLSNYE
jgi:hypothetical protein